ncbi:S8 family serine peptidase [Limibacter armeniacum]|uniref:S8 family serine peptidase n=1 Tax=Limibacter armeniacum TaxID=466084 RepID=UPI002FE54FDD
MKKTILFLWLSLCFFGGHTILAQNGQNNSSGDFVSGKVRIKFKEEHIKNTTNFRVAATEKNSKVVGLQSVDNVSKEIGIHNVKRVFPFSPKFEAKHRKYGLHLWYEVEFDTTESPMNVLKKYEKLAEIEIVKPVYRKHRIDGERKPVVFTPTSTEAKMMSAEEENFNDPLLPDQWHYGNDGRVGEADFDIDLLEAWQTTSGSSNVIVSVVDQGVDVEHEDLADNIWVNTAELNGKEGVDDDGNGYIDDYYGWNFSVDGSITPGDHGTHVAGTVGAVSNNGIGVAGVAGGDGSGNGVKIMSCQVFDTRVNGGLNFAEAIVYGADNGAVISQNSWGYNLENYYEQEVLDAIKYFIAEAGQYEGSPMKGGILFFAAGNNAAEGTRYPGAFDEVIAVTATGPSGFPAPYTNFGEWTDIAAPGGDMTNFSDEGGVLSTLPNNKYGYMQGTSMACPHASGVAALIVAKFGGEDFTSSDLRRIMLNSVDRFIFQHDNKYGKGYLNAAKSLMDDERIPPVAITDLRAIEVFHNEIRLSWTVPQDPDGTEPSEYYLAIGESEITAENFDNQMLFLLENNLAAGEEFQQNIGGFLKEKDYWFAIKSADQFENTSTISNILHVKTSKEPHFMESTRIVDLEIDVNENPLVQFPLSFSNIGEGIVYWETSISNEDYYFVPQDEVEVSSNVLMYKSAESYAITASEENNLVTHSAVKAISEELLSEASLSVNNYWEHDDTEFISGLSYENENPPSFLAGSGDPNAGLIFATRFHIPYDYSFNLTHLEVGLIPEINHKPITVEIKKGSRRHPVEAQTVYVQEYYPDTTNVMKYYRIPIYRPQRFEDDEHFWVVLHFPKEMAYPLLTQFGNEYPWETFILSRDNGRTYEEAINLLVRPVIPMLRVMSTGNDGSYVFLDPNNGEIHAGDSNHVTGLIDAKNLTNGDHLASLGIVTNDIHKPMINIEVKVRVKGQLPAMNTGQVQEFSAFVNREQELTLKLENKGLGDLNIEGYSLKVAGSSEAFEDTLTVTSLGEGELTFKYQPLAAGVVNEKVVLQTNIGEVVYPVRITSMEEPVLAMSLVDSVLNVAYGNTATFDLTLKNEGKADLHYDLNHYSLANINNRRLPEKLQYTITSSDEIGGPEAGQWEDISSFGTEINVNGEIVNFDMMFPYFDEMIQSVDVTNISNIRIYRALAMLPLRLEGKGLKSNMIRSYDFGDRFVISFDAQARGAGNFGTVGIGGVMKYQIVLFRDGAIEYRYKELPGLDDWRYESSLIGIEETDSLMYHTYDDSTKLLHDDLVVRFEPQPTAVSMISEASVSEGTIVEHDSTTIRLTINPEKFRQPAGTYELHVVVSSNTFEGVSTLPFKVVVTGTHDIEELDSVIFKEPKQLGISQKAYANIVNKGSEKVKVTAVETGHPDFQFNGTLPLVINAMAKNQLPIDFNPSLANRITSELTLTFENGEVRYAVIEAEGLPAPSFTHTIPSLVSFNLVGGETTNIPFTVSSTADDTGLAYTFINDVHSYVAGSVDRAIGTHTEQVTDNYGYTWKASDSLDNFHRWEDISAEAELLNIPDEEMLGIPLPFDFPFYGSYYDSIWVTDRGFITVIEPEQGGLPNRNVYGFNKGDGFRGMIASFWATMRPGLPNEGVQFKQEADRIILQWKNFVAEENAGSDPGVVTFQLELVKDGSIYFHYKDVESWGSLLNYGLESPDESEVFEDLNSLIVSWAKFKNESTVMIVPPLTGSLNRQETATFDLMLSAADIYYPGIYLDTLVLRTNSEKQPEVMIPVELNVTGSPKVTVTDSLNWEEVIYQPNLILRKKLTFINKGYATATLTKALISGLDKAELFDESGNKVIVNTVGMLLSPIELKPWDARELEVKFNVPLKQNVVGKLTFEGNFTAVTTNVSAEIVDSPAFSWTATDQTFSLNNETKEQYVFSIENKGTSKLKYDVYPAVTPAEKSDNGDVIIDKIGNFILDKPVTVDSVALEHKEVADGIFSPFIEGTNYLFANKFTAPAGGFNMTHFKLYTALDAIKQYLNVMVYIGGEMPQDGTKVYEQKFVIDQAVNGNWIYFPLERAVEIPEGENFYVMITYPESRTNTYAGFETTNDEEIIRKSFTGLYRQDENHYWITHQPNGTEWIWKIRPITAAGDNTWLELDQRAGELLAGEKVDVTMTVNPSGLEGGTHSAKILVKSNDINHQKDEVNVTLNMNGAPKLIFYPNIYEDTIRIAENEERVLNYLFEELEGESINISLKESALMFEANLTQLSNTTAQVHIKTDYESEGVYQLPVELTDETGNVVRDSILIKVTDTNRAPVFNTKYEVITLNLADPNQSYTIDPSDLYTDLDGDELQLLAGNYTPEMVDMALGSSFISLHPLTEGTAQLVFGADDGKENGFVVNLVYVVIINDPDAVQGELDGFDKPRISDLNAEGGAVIYPNPITDNQASLYYNLEQDSNVTIDIFDSNGQLMKQIHLPNVTAGEHVQRLGFEGIRKGLYLCTIKVNGTLFRTRKVVVW